MKRYKVKVGEEFELDVVDDSNSRVIAETSKAARHLIDAKVRRNLAYFIVIVIAVALFLMKGSGGDERFVAVTRAPLPTLDIPEGAFSL